MEKMLSIFSLISYIMIVFVSYKELRYEFWKIRYDNKECFDKLIEDLFELSWKMELYNNRIWFFNLKQKLFLNYDVQKKIIKKEFYTRSIVQNSVEEIVQAVIKEIDENQNAKEQQRKIRKLLRLIEAELIERNRYIKNRSEGFSKTLVLMTIVIALLSPAITELVRWLKTLISLNQSIITTNFFEVIQEKNIPLSIILAMIIALLSPFIGLIFDTRRFNYYVKSRENYRHVLSLAKNYIKDEIS